MNTEQLEFWSEYIRTIAHGLNLSEWVIGVAEDLEDDTNMATVHHIDGRRVAIIYLGMGFTKQSCYEQRNSIVHELLHLHHIMATDIIELDLTKHLPRGVHMLLFQNFRRQIEYGVDALAEGIAGFFPLPNDQTEDNEGLPETIWSNRDRNIRTVVVEY